MGYEYLCAENKDEYLNRLTRFFEPLHHNSAPMIFEVFIDDQSDIEAFKTIANLIPKENNNELNSKGNLVDSIKIAVSKIIRK